MYCVHGPPVFSILGVQVLTKAGAYVRTLGTAGDDKQRINRPAGVAVEAGDAGLVYIADASNHRVLVLTKAGAYVRTLGDLSQCAARRGAGSADEGQTLDNPTGVAVEEGEAGLVYIADWGNHRVQVLTKTGTHVARMLSTMGVSSFFKRAFLHPCQAFWG